MDLSRRYRSPTINILIIVVLIALPVFVIFFGVFGRSSDTWGHIVVNLLPSYTTQTLFLLCGTALLTLLFGVSTAWLVAAYEFPFRRQFDWLLTLPLTIPTYIAAYAYSGLFEYTGPVFTLFRQLLNLEGPGLNVRNIYGAIAVISAVLYPYVFIAARASFLTDSGRLFEAARSLGGSPQANFFRVVLPVSRPAIVAGLSLVVMEVLNEYGAVKYYGVPTFTTGIFRAWFALEDLQAAIYLSSMLMTFVFALIVAERWQRGKKHFSVKSSVPPARYQLSGWIKWSAMVGCSIPLLLGFVLPAGQMLYWTSLTFGKVVGEGFFQLIYHSFSLSIVTALGCAMIAVILIYSVRLNKNRRVELMSKLSVLGYSIPGAALAVGIMMTTLFVDQGVLGWISQLLRTNWGLVFTGSIAALVYAYIVRYLAVGYYPIDSGFSKITFSLTEVSRTLGVGPWRSLFSVNLPLLKPALWSAVLLVFVDVMKELPLTLILRPFNFETLATRAFRYANDEMVPESAPVSLLIIATGIIPVILLNRHITKRL